MRWSHNSNVCSFHNSSLFSHSLFLFFFLLPHHAAPPHPRMARLGRLPPIVRRCCSSIILRGGGEQGDGTCHELSLGGRKGGVGTLLLFLLRLRLLHTHRLLSGLPSEELGLGWVAPSFPAAVATGASLRPREKDAQGRRRLLLSSSTSHSYLVVPARLSFFSPYCHATISRVFPLCSGGRRHTRNKDSAVD